MPQQDLVDRRVRHLRGPASIGLICAVLVGCSTGTASPSAPSATPASSGTAPSESASAPASPEAAATITFTPFPLWNGVTGSEADGQPQDYWQKIANDYTADHPNVTIKVEMGDWATTTQTLAAQLTAGTPPDVSYVCDGNALTYEQYLVDLDPYIDDAYRADVTPATWDLYTVDGKVQILPAMVQWNTLIINADLFRERGVPLPADPERSWTWDEFMSAVRALTFTRDDGSKVYGTAVAGIAAANDVEWYNLHYMFNRGARFMDPSLKTFTLNDQAGVDSLQWLLDLQDKDHVIPPGAAGLGWEDAWNMLFRGQIAMWHGAPWVLAQAESEAASGSIDKAPDLEIVQYPHDSGQTMVTDIASCGFGVFDHPKDPNRTAAAVAFAKYVTSSDRLKDWKAGRYVPARLSSSDGLYAGDPDMTAYALEAPTAQHFWSRAVDILSYADQMNAVLPAVLNHEAAPKAALDKFVQEAQPIFDAGLASPKP